MELKNFFFNQDIPLDVLNDKISRKILAYNENMMVVEVHMEEGAIGAPHSHRHEQISYIIEGEFEFTIDGVKKIVKAGDSMYKQPHVVHGGVCLKKGYFLDIFTPHREDFLDPNLTPDYFKK